jgi:hypothetical protein
MEEMAKWDEILGILVEFDIKIIFRVVAACIRGYWTSQSQPLVKALKNLKNKHKKHALCSELPAIENKVSSGTRQLQVCNFQR